MKKNYADVHLFNYWNPNDEHWTMYNLFDEPHKFYGYCISIYGEEKCKNLDTSWIRDDFDKILNYFIPTKNEKYDYDYDAICKLSKLTNADKMLDMYLIAKKSPRLESFKTSKYPNMLYELFRYYTEYHLVMCCNFEVNNDDKIMKAIKRLSLSDSCKGIIG